jgi:hypothetical protein
VNARQLEIIQHTLGVDQYGRFPRGGQYRNFFCAGGADEVICRELVALGLMKQHATTEVYPDFNCSVTDEGRVAMFKASPNPPKLSRSQKRYQAFLDADCGVTFGEWIKRERQWVEQ